MKILLIGLGSIGTRHLQNILALGYTKVDVVSSKTALPAEFTQCQLYKTIDEAFNNNNYHAAIICTPSAMHAQQLIQLLQHHIPMIYVEKPVSNSMSDINTIRQLAVTYPNRIIVGYDLHFDPGMQKVKELLTANAIGTIVSVNVFAGQHLSQWRPYEDHRKGMSARQETGGGVLLDLIHEFDYLYRLFGDVTTVSCNIINTGSLEIETEESADVSLKFSNGVSATVHLDYLQQQLIRYAIITGTNGTITLNLAERFVHLINKAGKDDTFNYNSFERNERFVTAMQSFLSEKDDERFSTFEDGIKSLAIVLAAKEAASKNCVVSL